MNPAGRPRIPLEERFWTKTKQVAGGCIEWQGARLSAGYGKTGAGGRGGKTLLTHRVAYELTHGPIPDGMFVCHHCDNPPCVNVDHLFLGTHEDNTRDKMDKGRHGYGALYGDDHPKRKKMRMQP